MSGKDRTIRMNEQYTVQPNAHNVSHRFSLMIMYTHIHTHSLNRTVKSASGTASTFLTFLSGFLAYAFSSTNPDLVNSNIGQDVARPEYLNATDPRRNIPDWLDGSPSFLEFFSLLPPQATDLVNEDFLAETLVSLAVALCVRWNGYFCFTQYTHTDMCSFLQMNRFRLFSLLTLILVMNTTFHPYFNESIP